MQFYLSILEPLSIYQPCLWSCLIFNCFLYLLHFSHTGPFPLSISFQACSWSQSHYFAHCVFQVKKIKTGVAILICNSLLTTINQKIWGRTLHRQLRKKIHQEIISVLNIYASNVWAPIFVKETLFKLTLYLELHTLIMGELNIPFSHIDRLSRQKRNRKIIKQIL